MFRDFRRLVYKKFSGAPSDNNGRVAKGALLQDVAKSAGLFLGANQRYLPLAVKRNISAYRVFG
jgi:hypothetical protein